MRSLGLLLLLAACTDVTGEPTAPNQLRDDGKADISDGPLWAGLTSITIARYAPDPCNDGRNALGDDPVLYDEWARTRAAIRNICFEVWSPGITDWDNPDFWRELDVRVHYRFGTGEHSWAYVPSIDRRGNNRRYAFALDFTLDPTVNIASLPQMKAPFRFVSEANGWARIQADLEIHFTVNGRVLNSPSNRPFVVRYENQVRIPEPLAVDPDGYVLHDIVTCDGARFGSGAGFFAADLRDPTAIAALTGENLIYGISLASSPDLMSLTYSTQIPVAGESLPGFEHAGGLRIRPQGTSMRVELDVYDRALGTTRQLATTFHGCSQ